MKINLYSLREESTELSIHCHKNINRIIELMTKDTKNAKLLGEFTKSCLVLEKLCEYISNCCCNADIVSKHIMYEYTNRCSHMANLCKKIKQYLTKDDAEYIRCDKMVKLCNNKHGRKKGTKKN